MPQRAALRQTAKFFRQILGVIADPLQRLRREKNVEILLAAWTIRFGQMPVKQGCLLYTSSHAASFALIAYASAYLKCHYLAAFTAALLNNQPMGFYHPSTLVKDCLLYTSRCV